MNEARRFVRYAIPGLVFGVFAFLLLWLFRPELIRSAELKTDSAVAFAFAAILASGGLGAFFSTVYHRWDWRPAGTTMHHVKFLARLANDGILDFGGIRPELSRAEAWSVIVALWHERTKTNPVIEGAEPRTAELIDLVHSTGTNLIAVHAAAVVGCGLAIADLATMIGSWTVAAPQCSIVLQGIAPIVAAAAAWYLTAKLFTDSHRHLAVVAQLFAEEVLGDVLRQEYLEKGTIKTYPALSEQRLAELKPTSE